MLKANCEGTCFSFELQKDAKIKVLFLSPQEKRQQKNPKPKERKTTNETKLPTQTKRSKSFALGFKEKLRQNV